jgi:hypothetical protein
VTVTLRYFNALMNQLAQATDMEGAVNSAIADILGLIKKQKELRFFVDGTRNFGHQSATVHIMKRLIDMTEFNGRVKVIFADAAPDAGLTTGDKFAILLPGVDPRNLETAAIQYGSCQNIRFVSFQRRQALGDEVQFGFTGGADDMGMNLSAEVRVKSFVRLQPYLWDEGKECKHGAYYESSRIESSDGKYFYPVDEYPDFRKFPYKFARMGVSMVGPRVWQWYESEQNFDQGLGIRTRNTHVLYRASQREPELMVWPIYGLHHFGNSYPEMTMNLVCSAFLAQQAIARPIVALFLNSPETVPQLSKYLLPFARDLSEKNYDLRYFKGAIAAVHDPVPDSPLSAAYIDRFVAQIAAQVRPWIDGGSRLTFLSDHDAETGGWLDISEPLKEASAGATGHDIIVALVGPIPVDIFNYFYATCEIPGVFEGHNSSSLALSLGRPFLQIPRSDSPMQNTYPSQLMGKNYEHFATIANEAALPLRDQRYQSYFLRDNPTDPERYFAELSKTSRFMVDVQNRSSDMKKYFDELGDFFQHDIHDKLLLGLLAQALSS